MKTNLKFTVILSAYHVDNSHLGNMLNTECLAAAMASNGTQATRAVGSYGDSIEQSFVVHTNSSNVVRSLVDLGIARYKQQCVLVSNNRKHEIALHNADGSKSYIGGHFRQNCMLPVNCAWTNVNGKYWTVDA